jgi:hypothetical protein
MIVFIGGGTFVRDAILVAREKNVSFGLMCGPEGASTDKSLMFHASRQFTDLRELLEMIAMQKPEMLRTMRPSR